MIEVILALGVVVIILTCAASSFGKGHPSGRTTITRPSDKKVDGFGGAQAADYTHGPAIRGTTSPGLPVSLRQERKRTETFRQSGGEEEDL